MPPLQVHISTEEEQTSEGERTVTLTGTPESVLLAQFLVQSNIDLFKKDHQQVGPLKSVGWQLLTNFCPPGWLPGLFLSWQWRQFKAP